VHCPHCGKPDNKPKPPAGYVSKLARLDCQHCGASVVIETQKPPDEKKGPQTN
jgi:transposase-like protein